MKLKFEIKIWNLKFEIEIKIKFEIEFEIEICFNEKIDKAMG